MKEKRNTESLDRGEKEATWKKEIQRVSAKEKGNRAGNRESVDGGEKEAMRKKGI